jgi:hypothetical protein
MIYAMSEIDFVCKLCPVLTKDDILRNISFYIINLGPSKNEFYDIVAVTTALAPPSHIYEYIDQDILNKHHSISQATIDLTKEAYFDFLSQQAQMSVILEIFSHIYEVKKDVIILYASTKSKEYRFIEHLIEFIEMTFNIHIMDFSKLFEKKFDIEKFCKCVDEFNETDLPLIERIGKRSILLLAADNAEGSLITGYHSREQYLDLAYLKTVPKNVKKMLCLYHQYDINELKTSKEIDNTVMEIVTNLNEDPEELEEYTEINSLERRVMFETIYDRYIEGDDKK